MAVSKDLMSNCSEYMSAYKSACEEDPKLKSFDTSLQQRANKMIDSLTVDAKTGSVSPHDVHKEVSAHLLEVTQGVANFITEVDDNVWENQALKYLVEAYFENTKKTLEMFNTIEECVDKARMGQLIIRQALQEFEKESAENDVGGKKKKYENTLKDLKQFKELGDPFDSKVLTNQFESIKTQQELLLEEVCLTIKKLEENITSLGKEKQIANAVFGGVFACATNATIALLATGIGTALVSFGALSIPLIAVGWAGVYFSLDEKRDALKRQLEGLQKLKDAASSVEKGIKTNEVSSDTVSILVKKLETRIQNMLKLVDNALDHAEDEGDTKLVIGELRTNVEQLTEKIQDVGTSVKDHSKLIAEARVHVLQKING